LYAIEIFLYYRDKGSDFRVERQLSIFPVRLRPFYFLAGATD